MTEAPRLLERETEIRAFERSIAAGGGLVVVQGGAGIGKTRVLAEARRLARAAGLRVLGARASEAEAEHPYGVVRQLLEPAEGADRLTPIAEAGRSDVRVATLHALYRFVADLAHSSTVLLAIDDLHWCDAESLRWLAYLLRRAEGLPVLVAVTHQAGDPGTDAALLADVTHDPLATVLRPAPLSLEATAALVRSVLPADDAFCAACLAETAGNPLLTRLIVDAFEAEGVPPAAARVRDIGLVAVSRLVAVRFARLPEPAAALARAVAIFGADVGLRDAAALAGLDADAAHAAFGLLTRVGVLRAMEPLAFVHPLVRAAVAARIPPSERARAHGQAARLLAVAAAPVDAVAARLLDAPSTGDAWAVTVLRDAAAKALGHADATAAVRFLRRALREPPPVGDARLEVQLELAGAEELIDGPSAVARYEEALAVSRSPVAADRLAACLELLGRVEEALAVLERSQGRSERFVTLASGVPAARPRALGSLADSPLALALNAAWAGRSREEALALARRALATRAPEPASLRGVVEVLFAAGSLDEAGRLLEPAPGSAVARAVTGLLRSRQLLFAGSLTAAESAAREGLETYRRWAAGTAPAWAAACLAEVLIEQGRLEQAASALGDDAPAFSAATAAWFAARGRLQVLQGRAEEGVALLLELGRDFAALDGTNPAVHAWRSEAALGLLALGARERAVALADEEVALARGWGAPAPIGRALRVAGICAGEPRLLREAVTTLEPSGARLELAKALVDLGAALRRGNRRADARAPLRRGLEEATACEAGPLVARAESELSAAGARRRRHGYTGARALTPSERRVAELAAGGASNRDIAAALFVTVKTVEVHLSSAYRKLGIASRDQLSRALPPR